MSALLFYFAAICALVYLPLTTRPPSILRSVFKTAAVMALSAAALLGGGSWLLALALGLCAIGDYFLSRDGDNAFMAGVGAFAAGHLAYIVLFMTRPEGEISLLAGPAQVAVMLGLTALGVVMSRVLGPRAGDLRGAVLCYIPIILGMGIAALTLPADLYALALPAAFAFMASDVILAFETFVLPADHQARRITPYAIWPLYWGAQAGFFAAFG
ncbi:MAG: lysoplasmalogenase [Rhodobacteraceae bacterium]|nr:lysoplasmalogenase [Paracoccaceae bacterium]